MSTLSLDLCTIRDTTLTQNVNVRCCGSPAPKLGGKGDTKNCSFVFWGAVMAAKKAFDVGDIISVRTGGELALLFPDTRRSAAAIAAYGEPTSRRA